MSQVLVCIICNNIYKKEILKSNEDGVYICPNRRSSCGHDLISVDENLAELVILFHNVLLETYMSCEGHPYNSSSPYLGFCERSIGNDNYGIPIEKLREICISLNDGLDGLLTVTEIKILSMSPPTFRYYDHENYKTFTISVEFDQDEKSSDISVSESLETKYDFVNALYTLYSEIEKEINKGENRYE